MFSKYLCLTLMFSGGRGASPSQPNIILASRKYMRQSWWTLIRSAQFCHQTNSHCSCLIIFCSLCKKKKIFLKIPLLNYRLLLIMNKLEIITKVKNPPGDFFLLLPFIMKFSLPYPALVIVFILCSVNALSFLF